jgi:hypothetical protein
MITRTTQTQVTFRHPFRLAAVEGMQPAGTYRLVTDEEQIPGLSFVASGALSRCSVCRPIRRPARCGLIERLPSGDTLCHGDLHPDKVIMTAQGPCLTVV